MTIPTSKVKLSQWDALLLESLRALSGSDEELLRRVSEGDLPADESKYEFDYGQLSVLAEEQPEGFRRAVLEGYQIKYNTIRGIRSWIEVALGIEAKLELAEGRKRWKRNSRRLNANGWRMYCLTAGRSQAGLPGTAVPERTGSSRFSARI